MRHDGSVFHFIEHIAPDLFEIISEAEMRAETDPVVSLFRARQFAEFLVFHHLRFPSTAPVLKNHDSRLFDEINKLKYVKGIDANDLRRLHFIRVHGNDSVHRNLGDAVTARHVLEKCYELAVKILWPDGAGPRPDPGSYRFQGFLHRAPVERVEHRRAWIIRPYSHYVDCRSAFRRRNLIAIGWPVLGNLSRLASEQIAERLKKHYPDRGGRWERDLETLLIFRDAISVDDLVIMLPYSKDESTVAIGLVTGPYSFVRPKSKKLAPLAHHRDVRWFERHHERSDLPEPVRRNSRRITIIETDCRSLSTFCQQRGYLRS